MPVLTGDYITDKHNMWKCWQKPRWSVCALFSAVADLLASVGFNRAGVVMWAACWPGSFWRFFSVCFCPRAHLPEFWRERNLLYVYQQEVYTLAVILWQPAWTVYKTQVWYFLTFFQPLVLWIHARPRSSPLPCMFGSYTNIHTVVFARFLQNCICMFYLFNGWNQIQFNDQVIKGTLFLSFIKQEQQMFLEHLNL